jgi:putative toxin-antitoxin system antitoxin component (TIGR02293 family)
LIQFHQNPTDVLGVQPSGPNATFMKKSSKAEGVTPAASRSSKPPSLSDELNTRFKGGMPAAELFKWSHRIGVTQEQFARLSGVNAHKLRRGRGGNETVGEEVGASFVRCARLYERALALCGGNEEAARNWLNAEAPALGRKKPIDVAETEAGFKKAEALIAQLEKAVAG